VSLLHQGKGGASEDLEGDKPFPTPDQEQLETSRARYLSLNVHLTQNEHVIWEQSKGFLCTKAKLFQMILNIWGRASHTKKNGVKDNFLGLKALTKNCVIF